MRKPYQNFKRASIFQDKLLSRYQQQLSVQQQLLTVIKSVLPENLGKHVQYAVVNQNRAVLFTHSPAFATQLRFYTSTLQTNLCGHKSFSQIEQVLIRLMVAPNSKSQTLRQALIPSLATINFLRNTLSCNNQATDPLQQALNSLSQTLEKLATKENSVD